MRSEIFRLAGLRAAQCFEHANVDYIVYEGSDRVGGRVYPFAYKNGYLHYGAEYVNGTDNEIYQIVEKHDLLHKPESRTGDLWMLDEGTITVVDGKRVEGDKLQVWKDFVQNCNDALNEEANIRREWTRSVAEKIDTHLGTFLESYSHSNNWSENDSADLKKLCAVFKNYFQTEWSSPADELGMKNLYTWTDGTDVEDSAVLNEFGFQRILEEFKKPISNEKIRLNSKVVNIRYGDGDGVWITLENGEREFHEAVIVTCSLGYLKRYKKDLFSPPLQSHKDEAIARMGFGSNMKVFLEYEQAWWPQTTSTIIAVSENEEPDDKLKDNLMVFQPSSWAHNILVAWIAGCGPHEVAQRSDTELKTIIDEHLKKNLNGLFHVENSTRIFRHDWINDQFALGSYSYFTPEIENENENNDCIEVLGEPIMFNKRPVICFAGEHTDPEIYQTTIGAARSGYREAARITLHYTRAVAN
uniref:Amino_oxidase domain-containing protein n=1 Tax=Caenorhabditis japonica TaxID=281687 RepID=A0A8R1HSY7_CAEJA